MNRHVLNTKSALKNHLEEQLERMGNLSLQETNLHTEATVFQEVYDDNFNTLSSEQAALADKTSKIYERRDEFCKTIHKAIKNFEENDGEETINLPEPEKSDVKVAYLRRLNATVNLEMIVIKAGLARAKEEKEGIDENRISQKRTTHQISNIKAEVHNLEITEMTSGEKRIVQQDVLTLAPSPKRRHIADPVPPNSPEDDSKLNQEVPDYFEFSGAPTAIPKIDFGLAEGLEKPKPFVFKRATNSGSIFDAGTSEKKN